jgi:carbon-monoxide dehydrogenase small subunit
MSEEETTGIALTVNGEQHQLRAAARRTLAEVLREDLDLTGTHLGCEQGVCGACTVVVDGVAVRSCLILAAQADGSQVQTVEGLQAEGRPDQPKLHRLQEEFWNHQGLQCGFCTPGFLMTALVAARETPDLTRAEWRARLAGNVCRCTGYESIVDAVCAYAQREEVEGR